MLFSDVVIPERPKPKFIEKVPQPIGNVKMPKMTKNLKFMRGPEEVHNSFIHEQYGVVVSLLFLRICQWRYTYFLSELFVRPWVAAD